MAEWKPSFERGISNFRLGKYEVALTCFNEVRFLCASLVEGIDCGVTVRNERRFGFPTVRLASGGTRETWRPQGRSRGCAEGHRFRTTSVAGLREMRKALLTDEEA